LSQKNAVITGANKSIGFQTALDLGKLGYKVWVGCRDATRGSKAVAKLVGEGIEARILLLDVLDASSIQKAVEQVAEADGKLDVLINNAGVSGAQPIEPSDQPMDDIRAIYETNVFGPIKTTQAFLPLLKKAHHARIIMVSSGLGSLTWTSDLEHPYSQVKAMGYTSSKAALNAITVAFAKECAKFDISVNAVDPGYTATDFNNHTGYRTVVQAASGIVWLACSEPSAVTGKFFFDKEIAPW